MREDFTLSDNAGLSRYELHRGGELIGLADYYQAGDRTVIPHTEIDPGFGGQGLGGELVRFALDDIRSKDHKVVPACPFVGAFIAKNPDYADLIA